MEIITGEKNMNRIFVNKQIQQMKKRFCFDDLMAYLNGGKDPRVCTLYGLRRTGKTTLMTQAAKQLNCPENILWIQCELGDSMQDIKNAIKSNPDCSFIFLDEATNIDGFIETSSILSDRYCAEENKKIILTGTDSLGIRFALNRGLFDRAHVIHTTYIPFKEHHHLLGIKDVDTYIQYGGTLTNGKVFYQDDSDYTNSAIAANIQHSLEQLDDGGAFGPLMKFYAADELMTFIQKIIEQANRTFLAKTVNRMFKSHALSKLQKNLLRKSSVDIDLSGLERSELNDLLQKELMIKDPLLNKATPESIQTAKDYLKALDVIYIVPGTDEEEIIFIQPGLRYGQVQKLMDRLKQTPLLKQYSPSERKLFCEILDTTVKGEIMKDILYYQLSRDSDLKKTYEVIKCQDMLRAHEFDLVLCNAENDEAFLLDVKHSKEYLPNVQARHLLDKDACRAAEDAMHVKVKGKAVIYRGKRKASTHGILYEDVTRFLNQPEKSIKLCRKVFQNYQSGHD